MKSRAITLHLHADAAWIPLVQAMARHSGPVFGLDHDTTQRLTMAAEEILAYLSGPHPGTPLTLSLTPGADHVNVLFSFAAADVELWAMNITARDAVRNEDELQSLGLLLAARMSDGMEIRREGGNLTLRLRLDRVYPQVAAAWRHPFDPRGPVRCEPLGDPARIKEACLQAAALYPAAVVPQAFATPGRVVDRTGAGELSGVMALDQSDTVCGFMTWEPLSPTSVAFNGPYVFTRDTTSPARLLTDAMISSVARTSVSAVLSTLPTADLPLEVFESLGTLPLVNADGNPRPLPVWYRGMGEDNGLAVWSHPELDGFLRREYQRLFLMRDIHHAVRQGEKVAGRSVFATSLCPAASQALLTPMLDGADAEQIIGAHVRMLNAEGYRNILFHLDLSQSWQAALAPALLGNNFQPRIILPHAGRADLLVLHHA